MSNLSMIAEHEKRNRDLDPTGAAGSVTAQVEKQALTELNSQMSPSVDDKMASAMGAGTFESKATNATPTAGSVRLAPRGYSGRREKPPVAEAVNIYEQPLAEGVPRPRMTMMALRGYSAPRSGVPGASGRSTAAAEARSMSKPVVGRPDTRPASPVVRNLPKAETKPAEANQQTGSPSTSASARQAIPATGYPPPTGDPAEYMAAFAAAKRVFNLREAMKEWQSNGTHEVLNHNPLWHSTFALANSQS